MIQRLWWASLITEAWKRRSIVWLSGVRRSGKTMLCKGIDGARYLDCELPSVRRELADPESFLKASGNQPIILDEIHRLDDPALILKIAADHFPGTKVIATGSSTLGASAKFKDSLSGRKADVRLTPLCSADNAFPHSHDMKRRFLHGGLPGFFLQDLRDDRDYGEWMESFWARDILELFRLDRRASFLKFAELLFAQSGGRFEASSMAAPCGVSRTTLTSYLAMMEETFLVGVVRPYHGGSPSEIVATPLVYGFDTGFVAWSQGIHEIPPKDAGFFFEHVVLNELYARLQTRDVFHWRDKRGREVDFVLAPRGKPPLAIEVKWHSDRFDPAGMKAFRALHPGWVNIVVSSDTVHPFTRSMDGLDISFCSLESLIATLAP